VVCADNWRVEATSAPRPHGLRLPKPRRVLGALSDERLVDHVRRGDASAFEVLFDRHSAGVLAFCRHMLGSAHDAEDAVQQAFIAAHADLHRRMERDIHFKAWLYTIARNRCLSMLRARREEPSEDLQLVADRVSDNVQQREDLRELLTDVRKLPEDQREALVLSEVGALSHIEVAQVIGCEATKVKSLVFQARTALIDRRIARETPCEDIREQLATLRGGALRRSHLRHHLDACPGCTQYRDQVRRQRQMLALALPVLPSAALRGQVLGALGLGGGAAGAGAGAAGVGGGLGVAAKSGLAKLGIATLVAGGAAGGAAVVEKGSLPGFPSSTSPAHESGAGPGGSGGSAGGTNNTAGGASGQSGSGSSALHRTTASTGSKAGSRSPSGTAHGFTPVQGGSNGAKARQFAATRGQGNHTGLTKTKTPTRKRTHHKTATSKPVHVKKTPAPKGHTPPPKTEPGTAPNTQSTPKTPAPKSQAPAQPAPDPAPATDPPPATPNNGTGLGTGTLGAKDKHLPGTPNAG
jgi:RNA polymerase sigma factor (sigma-70 family)